MHVRTLHECSRGLDQWTKFNQVSWQDQVWNNENQWLVLTLAYDKIEYSKISKHREALKWRENLPQCRELVVRESPDLMEMIQMESM